MRIGAVSMWGADLEEFRRRISLFTELEYDLIGVGESPVGYHDVYVALTIASELSGTAQIGPMVTSPHLRSPLATVRSMSALQGLSGGRGVLGFGAGNSIAFGTGQGQPTQAALRDYLRTMGSLFHGEVASWEGGEIRPLHNIAPTPIYYSALGPKAMALAGELADGVILQIGQSIQAVRESIAVVRGAAERVGRDPETVQIWAYSVCSVAETREIALRDIAAYLAVNAPVVLLKPGGMDAVPPDLRSALQEVQYRYDFRDHALAGGSNATLVEDFGLLEYLAGTKTIAGSPDEVATYLKAVEAAGVSLLMSPFGGQRDLDGAAARLKEAASGGLLR